VVTGAELLLLAVALAFFHQRAAQLFPGRMARLGELSRGMGLLLGGWTLIAGLSLNFGAISLAKRLSHGLSAAESIAADFGDEARVVRAVRETTPETAAILIKTQRPLQFILNYELYPRKFYFYPERFVPISSIPNAWLDDRHIGWTLEISDIDPLHFELIARKASH
jgi:hypothetical protein